MIFGLTRGEILMVAFISALILLAGIIPKLTRALAGERERVPSRPDVE